MSTPTLTIIKRLFAMSGNKCAFPSCEAPLIESSGTVTGEICHICAANPDGPRFDKNQTTEERHSFANLILLCSRHHKIIDTETEKYSVSMLKEAKRQNETGIIASISPEISRVAQQLLEHLVTISVQNNTGQVAINSPGTTQIQEQTINNYNIRKPKAPKTTPPIGSIGSDRAQNAYIDYLIGRYQQYQKADTSKQGSFKYILIHNALTRTFKGQWKYLSTSDFEDVAGFLKKRIDSTKQGRYNRSRNWPNYESFEDHSK